MAAAAVANGGYLMRPILVKRVEDAEGRLVKETKPLVVRRVLTPATVDTLTEILRTVVVEGTGRKAAVPDCCPPCQFTTSCSTNRTRWMASTCA